MDEVQELDGANKLLTVAVGALFLQYPQLSSKDQRLRELLQNIVSAAGRVAILEKEQNG